MTTVDWMEQAAEGSGERETALGEHIRRLGAARRLEDVQEIVRSAPRRLVGAMGSTLVLREGDQCFYADEDAASPMWKGQRFPVSRCISGWAMVHGETVVVPDITADERIPQEAYRPTFVRSLVMVPIGRPPIAAMGAYWGVSPMPSTVDVGMLELVAAAAADAIARIGLDSAPFTPVLLPR